MSVTRIANRYAKSIVSFAKEQDSLENIYQDAEYFLKVCKNSRDFEVILSNPIIPQHKKSSIVSRILSGRLSELTMKFINLVIKKGRGAVLVPIFRRIVKQYKEMKGIATATVYSSINLSDDVLEKMKGFVKQGKKTQVSEVELRNVLDKNLLGGFVLQFDDKLLDKSVATQLKEIGAALKN